MSTTYLTSSHRTDDTLFETTLAPAMPLGIERINARTAQPNPNINFIKPQDGPHKAHAQDFLERVAAICVPIMKRNHIYVMSLEDFPPNDEFLGRNFNAGEKIQLVLRNKRGGWLPFKFVQRVMMHELAHCKQMNHSKYFWQVNNQHCAELTTLWEQGYTGEGMWSKGVLLSSGNYVQDRPLAEGDMPQHLCGGTFRSNRKRKRGAPEKEKISYQERQQRRIAKKFGTNGVTLGADDEIKAILEKGKRTTAKPRVAGSVRGRELRAAAALARFEKPQSSAASSEYGELGFSDSESDEDDSKVKPDDARDINGHRLEDSNGRGMIKVCEDDDDNADAQREMDELRSLDYIYGSQTNPTINPPKAKSRPTFGVGSSTVNKSKVESKTQLKSHSNTSSLHSNQDKSIANERKRENEELPAQSHYKSPYSNIYGAPRVSNPSLTATATVKREVFDILSEYLGDPGCNPEGAIYSGLDAAKAGMSKQNLEVEEEKYEEETIMLNANPTFLQSNNSLGARKDLLHPDGLANRGIKRDSRGFARAVAKHRSEESGIGLPSSRNYGPPSAIPKQLPPPSTQTTQTAQAKSIPNFQSQEAPVAQAPPLASQPQPPTQISSGLGVSRRAPKSRKPSAPSPNPPSPSHPPSSGASRLRQTGQGPRAPTTSSSRPAPFPIQPPARPEQASTACNICTTINDAGSLTCMICSNVLHPDRDPFHWKCRSAVCKGTEFVNSGDYGVCAVCSEKPQLRI